VTGSSYLLEDAEIKALVDCGMFQERNFLNRNWDAFPIPAYQIQYVLLTHIHQDHSGLIPKLVKEGFKGQILLTPASKEYSP
jgi:metallo-beta-lactamase family protein